jgi:hypothetical protein
MAATLRLTHQAIGADVRRRTYDVVIDRKSAGSVELNGTIDIPVEPGRHTLRLRNGRNSNRTKTIDTADGETVAFRCSGKSIALVSKSGLGRRHRAWRQSMPRRDESETVSAGRSPPCSSPRPYIRRYPMPPRLQLTVARSSASRPLEASPKARPIGFHARPLAHRSSHAGAVSPHRARVPFRTQAATRARRGRCELAWF